MEPKMEARTRSFFGHLAFFVPDGLGSLNNFQGRPQELPRLVKPRSPLIFCWFLMIFWWFSVSCDLLFIWFASLFFELPRPFISKFLATSELCCVLLQSNRPPHTNSRGADSSLRKGLRRMLCHSLGCRRHFGWPAPRTTPTAPLWQLISWTL